MFSWLLRGRERVCAQKVIYRPLAWLNCPIAPQKLKWIPTDGGYCVLSALRRPWAAAFDVKQSNNVAYVRITMFLGHPPPQSSTTATSKNNYIMYVCVSVIYNVRDWVWMFFCVSLGYCAFIFESIWYTNKINSSRNFFFSTETRV